MGSGRPRSLTSAIVALALIAVSHRRHPHPRNPRASTTVHVRHPHPRPGAKGKDVRYLQRSLTRLGIATSIDGVFGKGTTRSVKALESTAWLAGQRRHFAEGREADQQAAREAPGERQLFRRRLRARRSGRPERAQGGNGQGEGARRLRQRRPLRTGQLLLARVAGGRLERHAPSSFAPMGPTSSSSPIAAPPEPRLGWSDRAVRNAPARLPGARATQLRWTRCPLRGPRSGHIHQGQDIPASCGQKEMVDETGQVRSTPTRRGAPATTSSCMGRSPAQTPFTCTSRPELGSGRDQRLRRPADRQGRRHRGRRRLPPALRALDRAGVVRRRCRLRPAARAPLLGLILLGVPSREKVRVAERGEIRAITTIFSVAFQGDPTWSWAFPDPSQRPEQYGIWWGRLVEGAMRFPQPAVFVTEGMEAAALWLPPGEAELDAGG